MCAGGKGEVFCRTKENNFARKNPFEKIGPSEIASTKGTLAEDYAICVGHVMQCVWRAGAVEIFAEGNTIMKAEDTPGEEPVIGAPPAEGAVHALFDCAFAVCQASLMACPER
mmetsp:Transcript_36053/g.82408  ORF Transcript_36053/g.82408 Transcript_36053/m.82408 type:complete len:113 (+) Transcript_36053:568-906(+)